MFATLPDHVSVAGAVVTADAMHAQRSHAEYLVTQRGAHYLLTVKANQPGLHAQLAKLPWRQVPVAHSARERGHGRAERRTVKVTAVAAGLAFPHAAPGPPDRPPPPAAEQQEVARRDHLRDHLADRQDVPPNHGDA